ncbi:EAL and HDOD domain-containing protein [Thiohalorhabdus methylotrophus]|uniref:EAL and HDOD domain-containing protein n=1 Tax=Thiohalorhabdus methylotrophus TaxID=3242694 RepID=A0ABV4TW09_9GAMM
MQQIHIARYPVLDREQELFGYELQFRDPDNPGADASHLARELPTALVDTLDSPEFGKLLGGRTAFIHVSPEFISRGFADLLPAERCVLELVQTVEPDQALIDQLLGASRKGFRLALSLLIADPGYRPFYEVVDYIKVDFNLVGDEALDDLLVSLPDNGATLIAENVHSREAFEEAQDRGFHLFQGTFFARPSQITTESLSLQQTALLTLYKQVSGEAEFDEIEATFKENPDLSYKLLRLINSPAFHRAKDIHSIRQALALLGKFNLRKWIALLLYSGAGRGDIRNPLLEEAVIRGRLMELAAGHMDEDPYFAESAFITGAFSLIEALVQRPLGQVVEEVRLDTDIADALLSRSGPLGDLLTTIIELREKRALPRKKPDNLYVLRDADLYSYEEQATREFEELEDLDRQDHDDGDSRSRT